MSFRLLRDSKLHQTAQRSHVIQTHRVDLEHRILKYRTLYFKKKKREKDKRSNFLYRCEFSVELIGNRAKNRNQCV